MWSEGLIGFVLLERSLELTNRCSADPEICPAKGEKNRRCHGQNPQVHRKMENDPQISFQANLFSVL